MENNEKIFSHQYYYYKNHQTSHRLFFFNRFKVMHVIVNIFMQDCIIVHEKIDSLI